MEDLFCRSRDLRRQRLAGPRREASPRGPVPCGLCPADGTPETATSFCKDCDQPLCEDDARAHAIGRPTRTHSVVPISEAPGQVTAPLAGLARPCKRHPGDKEGLSLYCITCEELICKECALFGGHKGWSHKYVGLATLRAEEDDALRQACAKAGPLLAALDSALKDRSREIEALRASERRAAQAVREDFGRLRAALDEVERNACREISRLAGSQAEEVLRQAVGLSNQAGSLNCAVLLAKAATFSKSGDVRESIGQRQALSGKVEEVGPWPPPAQWSRVSVALEKANAIGLPPHRSEVGGCDESFPPWIRKASLSTPSHPGNQEVLLLCNETIWPQNAR